MQVRETLFGFTPGQLSLFFSPSLFFFNVHVFLPHLPPGIVAEQFLNNTATQLTYHGLCELTSTVQEGELCVFFRNNHFSTMIKFKVGPTEKTRPRAL